MSDFISQWQPQLLFIIKGISVNIQFTSISIILGLALGSLLAVGKVSSFRVFRYLSQIYTSIFRGTPVLIQLSIIYFVLPSILGVKISEFTAGIITFSLNSAAYTSEILRSGINSVEIGQIEASRALGIPNHLTQRYIIFPQAIRKILPALVNEFINLLKETSIISIIGVSDVLRNANSIAAQKANYLVPMLTAALTFYIVVLVIVTIANKLEEKLKL